MDKNTALNQKITLNESTAVIIELLSKIEENTRK